MVVITGLGRCGTSFMALLLKELGFGVGNSLSYDNGVRAGMEFSPAYNINREMYECYIKRGKEVDLYEPQTDSYWLRGFDGAIPLRDMILNLDENTPECMKEGKVEVIKDPRFTWHPKLIRAWWSVRKDLQLIILHRKPEDIIKSRSKAGTETKGSDEYFQDPKRGQNLQQFYDDYEAFVEEVNTLGIPYVHFHYPNFMTNGSCENLNRLKSIGIASDISQEQFDEAWDKIYDGSKISNFGD